MNCQLRRSFATANLLSPIHFSGHERNLGTLNQALRALLSEPNTMPDVTTFPRSLQLCVDSNGPEERRGLHKHALKVGAPFDVCLSTKSVIFYSNIRDVESARKVFDEMPQRSVVSWTAMVSGYSRNGYPSESLEVFSSMKKAGFKPNQFTYGSVIKACAELRCIRTGEQIHGCVVKSNFQRNMFVQSALVDFHLKCGMFEDAQHLFGLMECKDTITWNSLIGGNAAQGRSYESFEAFQLMLREGLLPDNFTFGSILKACAGVRYLKNTYQFHCFTLKMRLMDDSVVMGSLIDAYGKCRCLGSAKSLYDSMPKKDLISCSALITACALEKRFTRMALGLFHDITREMKADGIILCSMLSVCAIGALLSLGRQIHASILKSQSKLDVALSNALIDMYAKAGNIKDAQRAFDDMKHKNVISWTSLIAGYGRHGFGQGAISVFARMEKDGFQPNDVTFLSLLFACSHSGLTNQGIDYFSYMVNKYMIDPRIEHYSCIVDLLARGGLIEEAYDTICNMNTMPSISTWGSVLGACGAYVNISLGEFAARHLCSLNPERYVNYVMLANIYAMAGMWEDSCKTRKLMEERHIRKYQGISCVLLHQARIS